MLKKKLGLEAIERDFEAWRKYMSAYFKVPSTLAIPDGCERIGKYAFLCSRLEEVIIPKSVYVIRVGAFEDCDKLKEVVIPEGVVRIEEFAFNGCKKLEKVVISESVEYIGISSFCWCNEAVVTLKKPRSEFNFIATNAFNSCIDVKEEVGS